MRIAEAFRRVRIGLNRRLREAALKQGYSPRRFWELWGKVFAEEEYQRSILGQHRWLLTKIRQSSPRSILEVGCGFGRNLRFLQENSVEGMLIGVDFSRSMIRNIGGLFGTYRGQLVQGAAGALPFADRSFDFVFTMGLCMHIPPAGIRQVIGEVARVTRGELALIEEMKVDRAGPINQYTFGHDYEGLFAMHQIRCIDRQVVQNVETMLCVHGIARSY